MLQQEKQERRNKIEIEEKERNRKSRLIFGTENMRHIIAE